MLSVVGHLARALYAQYQEMTRFKVELRPLGDVMNALSLCLQEAQATQYPLSESACQILGTRSNENKSKDSRLYVDCF